MERLPTSVEQSLLELSGELVNELNCQTLLLPSHSENGFWIGAGGVIEINGWLYLSARYRSSGDSRTALEKGARGRELAIFRAKSPRNEEEWRQMGTASFEKIHAWNKVRIALKKRPQLKLIRRKMLVSRRIFQLQAVWW